MKAVHMHGNSWAPFCSSFPNPEEFESSACLSLPYLIQAALSVCRAPGGGSLSALVLKGRGLVVEDQAGTAWNCTLVPKLCLNLKLPAALLALGCWVPCCSPSQGAARLEEGTSKSLLGRAWEKYLNLIVCLSSRPCCLYIEMERKTEPHAPVLFFM